ncbi:hypothetical protein DYU05_15810 [Mucilaginibacter terrenus]|uniref:SGNH/GDSL hydrolase family protein n=1 Tax=Mucilaginibacter terrenus TaxID=2482727 RepID=A0A3E2NMA0_9SPHI|nr:hypothetical protein [Mucilaginibacter terrenus]RFZ82092.1 hypothetical protein DYU05_15810 [Mucilaginibacter terrenus]
MKRFILKFLLFIAPIVLLCYAVDSYLSTNLRKLKRGESQVWQEIYAGKINAKVWIYGASRAFVHIDPEILSDSLHQSAYNFGLNAYPIDIQYLRHHLLLKYNKKPKVIIHSLDFMTFQKRDDLFDPDQFLPFMLWDTLVAKHTMNYAGYTKADYYLPLARYYGKTAPIHLAFSLSTGKYPNKADRVNGYQGIEAEYVDAFAEGGSIKGTYNIKFDKQAINLFDRYLQECKRNGTKVIFVYTPEYISGQRYLANRPELFKLIKRFSAKYDIPLYDYSADEISFDKRYFYNAEHLNLRGSQLFSKKFAHDLKQDSFMKSIH